MAAAAPVGIDLGPFLEALLKGKPEGFSRIFFEQLSFEVRAQLEEVLRNMGCSEDAWTALRMASQPKPIKAGMLFPDDHPTREYSVVKIERDTTFLGKPVTYQLKKELAGIHFLIIVSFPKTWTPTCTYKHLDDWLKVEGILRALGIQLAFHSRGTHFELDQYLRSKKPGYESLIIPDNGDITHGAGWGIARPTTNNNLGYLSGRYVSVIHKGTFLGGTQDDPPSDVITTSAEHFLATEVPKILKRYNLSLLDGYGSTLTPEQVETALVALVKKMKEEKTEQAAKTAAACSCADGKEKKDKNEKKS
ncbi:MAG TPA: hypothetical protein VLG44_06280 [Chlamydiales bacterium]|nr:hypothetical protein [Chlamydiales bacterium]